MGNEHDQTCGASMDGVTGLVECALDNSSLINQGHPIGHEDGGSSNGAVNCICIRNESYLSIPEIFEAAFERFRSPIHDTFSDFHV